MGQRGAAGAGGPAASLIEISRVLEETARLLREHAGDAPAAAAAAEASREEAIASAVARVRAILALRRLRRDYLGFEASDAAWSLMLETYAARLDGGRTDETMLGATAGLPHSTALSATRRLVDRGVLARDGNVVTLSESAAERIESYLAAAQRLAPLFA